MKTESLRRKILIVGVIGLLLAPALVYTQVTGRVLNPRLRTTYTSLQAAVAAAAAGDTLLVSGRLTGTNATADLTLFEGRIVAGRGLRGTLEPTAAACAGGPVIDASGRAGAVLIQGLTIIVPDTCIGVYSTLNGNPLTVRGLLIQRATATANITGIFLDNETGGPYLIERNRIPSVGTGAGAILVDGGAATIDATVRFNTVGSSGSPTFLGIGISDVVTGSSVVVERNRVGGGNNTSSGMGIEVEDSDGVIVRRNTVENFVASGASGIVIVESPNTQVLRNVIRNNNVGVSVCDALACGGSDTTETANTVLINNNNITSTVTGATGLVFDPDSAATAPLDATNNWWGAATGPRDEDTTPAAGECGGSPCDSADGGGLPVAILPSAADDDCGSGAGQILTCPFRTSPVSPAGA